MAASRLQETIPMRNPNDMEKGSTRLRIFLMPYLAKGHIIPMTDFACLLARTYPDVDPTVVVSTGNAASVRSTINHALGSSSYCRVEVLTYSFSGETLSSSIQTLGDGSAIESDYLEKNFHLARTTHEELLNEHKPDAMVADPHLWWVTDIAAHLGIPQLFFYASGSFPCLVFKNIIKIMPDIIRSSVDVVRVPGIPPPDICIPLSEIPDFAFPKKDTKNDIKAPLKECFGYVLNTFYEFEPDYCEAFKIVATKHPYFVGPVSLVHKDDVRERGRGGDGDVACLRWLDGKEDGSVVFVSFGSQSYFKAAQLRELAIGLANSGKNFLWVIRGVDPLDEDWIPQGWEDRVAKRGYVVRGWAPQVAILAHLAIGAFLTHCGWNSILEGITAGIPLLTWPLNHDQFVNERLIVEVTGCGARVWEGGKRSARDEDKELVPRQAIADVVSKFMEPGGGGERARCKARDFSSKARTAVAEDGSSCRDLNRFIHDLIETKFSKKK